MLTAKMNGVAFAKVFQLERRNSDGSGLEFGESFPETSKIGGVGKNCQIGVAAKLGCAVKHAGLTAHEQSANAVPSHRRKDFAYRVRDQANLQGRDRFAIVSRFRSSVAPV
jgi:hypothetical protein